MSHQPAKHKFAKYEPGSTFIGTNQAPFMSRTWFGLNSFMQQQALTMIFLDDMSSQPVCRTQRQLSNCLGAKLPWRNATICSSPKDGKTHEANELWTESPPTTIFHGYCITETSPNEWICLHFIRIFWMAKFLLRLSIMLPATCVVARAPYLNGKGQPWRVQKKTEHWTRACD